MREEELSINYYKARDVSLTKKIGLHTPRYMIPFLPKEKDAYILDIGCGQGSFIGDCVKNHNRTNVKGVDISKEVVIYCQNEGFPAEHINNLDDFMMNETNKYDFIYMSHVLEHLKKEDIVSTLYKIRTKLLNKNGKIFIVVPNAQSSTDCYWAYEDFTHSTLFTTGSLKYVLDASGFKNIEFVDLDGFAGVSKRELRWRKPLLKIYKLFKKLEMFITKSYYHSPSPISYCWEIKAIAYNADE